MGRDFFTYLPPEILLDILSRLPVRTTLRCKCVRKSWRSLIETPEFVKSYKSVPSLAVFQGQKSSIPYKVYELEDELNLENFKNPCNVAFSISLPQPKLLRSSANGLLLLSDLGMASDNLAIFNPVTREYINLPAPSLPTRKGRLWFGTFGFGVSKTTGQYKLVGVFREGIDFECENQEVPIRRIDEESYCQVYTLGTGLWRSIAPSILLKFRRIGALLNGNIHWLTYDLRGSPLISCFDLETELFSTFSSPRLEGDRSYKALSVLGNCLCLCDNSAYDEIVIWLMNEYGDGKSWTKEFIIKRYCINFYGTISPIKVFKDGDMLIAMDGCSRLLCYSSKTKTIRGTSPVSYDFDRIKAVSYTPSFLPLKTFTTEKDMLANVFYL